MFVNFQNPKVVSLPNNILNRFGVLSGTLNTRIPAIDMGILFKEPTRL